MVVLLITLGVRYAGRHSRKEREKPFVDFERPL